MKLETILSTVGFEEQEKKWLKGELQYSNELKLKERLVDLILTHNNQYIQMNITDSNTFCRDVVNTRNYNTHFSSYMKKKSLDGKELFDITQVLTGLLISCVLNYIGVENSIFEERLVSLLY